jgi:hypothetical protein
MTSQSPAYIPAIQLQSHVRPRRVISLVGGKRLCREYRNTAASDEIIRSIFHALKRDAEDSRTRLVRGKCFYWDGRRGGRRSSPPGRRCLCCRSSIARKCQNRQRLPVDSIALHNGPSCTWERSTPPLSTHTPQRNFIVSLADSRTASPATSPRPTCTPIGLGLGRSAVRASPVCKTGTSRIWRTLSNRLAVRPSVSRASSEHRLSIVLKQRRGPQGRVVMVVAFCPRTGFRG